MNRKLIATIINGQFLAFNEQSFQYYIWSLKGDFHPRIRKSRERWQIAFVRFVRWYTSIGPVFVMHVASVFKLNHIKGFGTYIQIVTNWSCVKFSRQTARIDCEFSRRGRKRDLEVSVEKEQEREWKFDCYCKCKRLRLPDKSFMNWRLCAAEIHTFVFMCVVLCVDAIDAYACIRVTISLEIFSSSRVLTVHVFESIPDTRGVTRN